MEEKRNRVPQYVAAIVVNMAAMVQGSVFAWTSPALISLQSENPPFGGEPVTDEEASWLGSLASLGSLACVPVYTYIVSRFSRKVTGYCVGIPPVICWIIIIFAQSKTALYVARFFIGCLGAGNSILCPLYVTEIVEDTVRGALGTYIQMMFYTGILVTYIVGGYASYTAFGWYCFAFSLTFVTAFYFLPESPIYLASKYENEKAKQSLLWLRGKYENLIEEEMNKIKHTIEVSKELATKSSFAELFRSRGCRRGLIISSGLMLNHILSGTFVVITFSVNIFKESGTGVSPELSAIIISCLQLFGIIPATALMDRAGRKALLIISNIGTTITLTIFGAYYYVKEQGQDISAYNWVPVACLCAYVLILDIGVSPIPFIMMNEVFPLQLRSYALTVIWVFFWAWTFASIRFFLPLAVYIGMAGCYWFFAFCCFVGIFFAYYIVPETKNRTLDSILIELSGKEVKSVSV